MQHPSDRKYTRSHEWLKDLGGGKVQVGLTDFAQSQLGDIVFIDLPAVGKTVTAETSFGDVESVKAVSEMLSPVTGTVSAVNEALADAPEKINEAALDTWILEVENVTETAELLDADAYEAACRAEA